MSLEEYFRWKEQDVSGAYISEGTFTGFASNTNPGLVLSRTPFRCFCQPSFKVFQPKSKVEMPLGSQHSHSAISGGKYKLKR